MSPDESIEPIIPVLPVSLLIGTLYQVMQLFMQRDVK